MTEGTELIQRDEDNGLMGYDEEPEHLQVVQPGALAAIAKSEVESQLDAAHKYPRSIKRFLDEALAMVSRSTEVASMCIYALPRDGKTVAGPSVRLAEIAASAYRNLQVGARPVDVSETEVTSQGVAWDMERNVRFIVEKKRRITGKSGRRFSEDMIITTQNAASSIALRDAIFRAIPRAYIQEIYERAKGVAVGKAETLANRRASVMQRLTQMGATQDRVLAKLGKPEVEAINLEDMEILIGLGTSIKEGSITVDAAFPSVAPTHTEEAKPEEQGRRMKLGGNKAAEEAK